MADEGSARRSVRTLSASSVESQRCAMTRDPTCARRGRRETTVLLRVPRLPSLPGGPRSGVSPCSRVSDVLSCLSGSSARSRSERHTVGGMAKKIPLRPVAVKSAGRRRARVPRGRSLDSARSRTNFPAGRQQSECPRSTLQPGAQSNSNFLCSWRTQCSPGDWRNGHQIGHHLNIDGSPECGLRD
jgi:hypothetical protein